jgi:hypothetical protein
MSVKELNIGLEASSVQRAQCVLRLRLVVLIAKHQEVVPYLDIEMVLG